jgi:hypothetical protein
VIKFVSDLQQVGGFLGVLRLPPPIKLITTIISEILLKVALNTTRKSFSTDIITPFMNLIYKMIERFSDLSKEHLAHILTPLPLSEILLKVALNTTR